MTDIDDAQIHADHRLTAFWAALFMAGMFGFPILGWVIYDWDQWVIFAGMIFSMFFLFPLVRSATVASAEVNEDTPAMRAYNRRILLWSFAYIILMFGAVIVYQRFEPTGAVLVLIALLPAIPILWSIFAVGSYLREEKDEYVRDRKIAAGIFGTGFLFAIATIWGFLDLFGLAPGMPGYMVMPIWAAGLGIWTLASWIRGS